MAVTTLFVLFAFLFGIVIGSFLNVVIYRLPMGLSVAEPQFSFCPSCRARLTAIDLVPLLSFLMLGRRCRHCHEPISWRYFSVELATGLLFAALALRFHLAPIDAIALMLFAAAMVPIYFIDFATFTIPDSLNLLAFVFAIGRDVLGIVQHEAGHAPLFGWLPRSIAGAFVATAVFAVIRAAGWLYRRQEAMGLGDPLLARAMGAMLANLVPGHNPLRLLPIWILLSCLAGLVVGPAIVWLRSRRATDSVQEEEADDGEESDGTTFGSQIVEGLQCLVLWDAWLYIRAALTPTPGPAAAEAEHLEEDFGPIAPTAIPFGPFLVIGFFAAVFVGEWLTSTYLRIAFHRGP